ncbi:PIN domain-containing protein [Methanocaldococcus jannaschii]|nr:PIN domain-containing protein [Methanocaldococcus jannaschii]
MQSLTNIEVQRFHDCEWEYFKEFDDEFNKLWNEIEKTLGRDFINYLSAYFQKNLVYMLGKEFKLKLVVDTNIIFSQVLSYVTKGELPWILDFINNPFIELYAPQLIVDELKNKIENVLPKKCKKKNIDENKAKSKAIKIANIILSNIKIINDKKSNNWSKIAYNLIGHRDVKDIPFVTLALSLDTHGIITRDKDFKDQKIIKIWKVGEVKVVLTELSQGSFSFCIMNVTAPLAFKICTSIIITILEIVTSIIKKTN